MQISKIWLQDYFKQSIDSVDLDRVLTMAGLEVESVKNFSDLSNNTKNYKQCKPIKQYQ